jgi:serine/threonine protein kinase
VGSVLGEYRVFEEIGRGGMGRVYKALQTKLDRVVAIKVLHSNRLHDDRAIARFEREMRTLGRLDHPNIVRAYDAREIDGNPVLVMEFVEGLDLARVLGSLGRVRTADACELVRQAAIGLQYASENGLVHRDVKPSNLIVTPEGEVKLLDLGLARLECAVATDDEMTGAGQPMGTADYIAPEQFTDARVADIRSDVYSLGCTLYKLLAGQTPFAESVGDPSCDQSTAQVERAVPPIQQPETDVPSGLFQLMNAMLAKSPDDRPATPSAVASAIEPYCHGHDLVALQSRATEAEWRRNRDAFKVALPLFSEKPPIRPENSARSAYWSSGKFWSLAVGLLILVSASAYAMSVVITIDRNKTKTSLEVPEGSRVAVNGQGDVNVTLPDGNEQISSPSAVDTRPSNSTSQGLSVPSDEHAGETPQDESPLMDKFVAAVLRHKHVNGDEYRLETEQWNVVCDSVGLSGRLYSRLMTLKVKNWIEDAVKYAMRMVRELDSNGDQVVTADEWSKVRHDHLLADTNEDGAVTRQELAAYLLDHERPSDFHEWLPEPGTTSDSSVHGNGSALRDSGSERDVVIRLDVGGNITFTVSGDAPTHLGKDFQQLVALIEKHSQQAAIRMEVESASGLPDGTLEKLMRACGVVGTAQVTVHVPDKVRPVVFVKNRQQHARGSQLTQTRQPVIMVRSRDNGGPVSADHAAGAPARLDFRIAAVRESKEAAGLSHEEIGKLIEQLVLADMVTPTDNTNSKYLWLECHKHVWDDITHRKDQWVSSMHAEKLYLLVSNEPDGTMLSSDRGDRAWKIASARPTKDSQDHLAISIELDKSGGRLLGELTQQHLNRPLAMIIDNKVVMVPTIRSKITNKVQISSRFAPDELDGLLKSLNVDKPTKGVK